jgi:hypothetical protein
MPVKLPSPVVATRRLAARLVEERSLTPPVNVKALLEEVADVEFAPWPHASVDAVISGLGQTDRPRVFLRQAPESHRQRFSMAHELAHIVVPWHMGRYTCFTAEVGSLELAFYGQEDEADVFASSVLIPEAWLKQVVAEDPDNIEAILAELNSANVSTAAALTALRERLLAGWVFGAYGGSQAWWSPGTKYPVHDWQAIIQHARENATEHGSTLLNGHPVQWYRMHPPSDLPPEDADSRSSTELLDTAVANVFVEEEVRLHVQKSANGKVGGALRAAGGQPAASSYSVLKYRFAESDLSDLLDEPDFLTWLARKARDVERRPPPKA